MQLKPVNPLSFRRFGSRYNRLFDRDFFLARDPFESNWMAPDKKRPPSNLKQGDDFYELEMSLPGYRPEEVTVEVADGMLTIRGEHQSDEPGASEYILREHDKDAFERVFELSSISDMENISAHFEYGVLYVRIPHVKDLPEKQEPRSIPIF